MCQQSPFRRTLGCVLLLGWLANCAIAGPPFFERILPGKPSGKVYAEWIAPFVLYMKIGAGEKWRSTVRWYLEDGTLMRELSGNLAPMAEKGYVTQNIETPAGWDVQYHAANGDWKIVLPEKSVPPFSGSVTCTADSRTFIYQFHPAEGQIAADVYVAGKLVGSVGPFVQYKARDVRRAHDGSFALLTWKTPERKTPQTVVVGPEGKVSLLTDCGQDVDDPYPVGGGKGVLVRVVGREGPPVRFRYSQSPGDWSTYDVGPNARPVAWTPRGDSVLFSTSIGEEERFRLVDCMTGKVLWKIPSPVKYQGGYATSALVVEDNFLFVGCDFAAVSITSGEVLARWEPNTPRSDRRWVTRRASRLFVVTDEQFAEIDPADIRAKRNGWH